MPGCLRDMPAPGVIPAPGVMPAPGVIPAPGVMPGRDRASPRNPGRVAG
ncbi:MAG: hypothetical protein J6Y63_05160 [Bacteroidales bacterium]|nr:hypothetical protein [Bacteroidales bacterium]